MADPVYTLLPNPHWVIIDNFSRLPNGAVIYTYSSLDPSIFKPAYQDAAGTTPYSQPIIGFGNGTMPPIFWKFDPDDPLDNYYIRVYDRLNNPGSGAVFLWDFNGLTGASGGGGGGGSVTVSDVENLVVNNVFFRNIGDITGSPSLPVTFTIAPSTHQGFVNDPTNASVIANGPVSPDIIFAKSGTASSDNVRFIAFTPVGARILSNTDITPQVYLQYNCTGAGAETYKYFQFPISQGVENLSEQTVSLRFYGQCTSGSNLIRLSWRQFFGSGGGSPDVITDLTGSPFALPAAFGGPPIQITSEIIPSVVGKTIGTCGNDGLFLQVGMPLNATTSIDFVKTELYLGTMLPTVEYDTHDQIDSITNTPRTGDIRITVNNFFNYGWALMNDGTIANGNPAIIPPAGGIGFSRNNVDTFPLFSLLWDLPIAVVPEYDSAGNPSTRGASAADDFVANRQLALTKAAGRVFAGVNAAHTIGTFAGSDTHNITLNEMAQHTHDPVTGQYIFTSAGPGPIQGGAVGTVSTVTGGITGYGGQTALSLLQPTVYCNVYIKL